MLVSSSPEYSSAGTSLSRIRASNARLGAFASLCVNVDAPNPFVLVEIVRDRDRNGAESRRIRSIQGVFFAEVVKHITHGNMN